MRVGGYEEEWSQKQKKKQRGGKLGRTQETDSRYNSFVKCVVLS